MTTKPLHRPKMSQNRTRIVQEQFNKLILFEKVASTTSRNQHHREASTRQAAASSPLVTERTATTESDLVGIESQPSTSSKFEAKSSLFWPLVADYTSAVPRQLKQQLELNANARAKIINLFTNYENYYTTMLAPIEENYALTLSSNKSSHSFSNDDKNKSQQTEESSGESEKTSQLTANIKNPAHAGTKRMRQIDDNSNSNSGSSGIAEDTDGNRRSTTSNEQNTSEQSSSNRSIPATTSSSASLSTDNTTTQASNPHSTSSSSSSRVTGIYISK